MIKLKLLFEAIKNEIPLNLEHIRALYIFYSNLQTNFYEQFFSFIVSLYGHARRILLYAVDLDLL